MSQNLSRTFTLIGALVFLAGCSMPTPPSSNQGATPTFALITETAPADSPTPVLTDTFAPASTPTDTLAPDATQAPPPTEPAPTDTPIPTQPALSTSTAPAPGGGLLSGYLDDRSTAIGLIQSLFNAVNRKEYVRAYSYWESPGQSTQPGVPGSYAAFQQGYQNTSTVQVVTGPVGSDAGAGQVYYSVPVALKAQTSGGQTQLFSGCYILHLARPEIQDAPPFHPLGIFSAQVKQQDANANPDSLAAHGCDTLGTRQIAPGNPMPTTNPNDITSANYLDDRSDAVLVLRSLFNAVNSKQYDRAYSYWRNPSSGSLPDYNHFKQGYQNTASVEATFGSVSSSGAAGNFYFSVPTALKVKTSAGATQTFAGCYLEHMADPGVFGAPPFVPLGLEKANIQQVDNNANINELLSKACANMP